MGRVSEQPDRRAQRTIDGRIYTGVAYQRVFDCPKGYSATALAGTLALGTVMPTVFGGPGTNDIGAARLQDINLDQQKGGGMDRFVASYVKVNVRAGGSAGYHETEGSRKQHKTPERVMTTVYAIASGTANASIPARKSYLDSAPSTSALSAVCSDVQVDPYWQHGRVLVIANYIGHELQPTLGP